MANEYDLPDDLLAAQQQLNRQQQLAQALMTQNQQPQGQMISGRYVAPSIFQQLQPVANMLTGAYLAKQGDTEAAKLAKEIRKGKAAAEESIINDITGYDKTTELAGPYTGDVPMPTAVKRVDPNLPEALRKINTNEFGAGKDLRPMILEQLAPKLTAEQIRYKAAVADGSWNPEKQGGFNAFLNQMSDKDKATLRMEGARLALAQREQAWNMGMPIGGGGAVGGGVAPQVPLQTINPGSPILAPQGQVAPQGVMPQGQAPMMPQGQMPVFRSKPEQELYMAKQKKMNELQAEALNALPAAKIKVETAMTAIDNMIGDTKIDAKGNLVVGEKKPHAGFYEAVGMPSPTNAFGFTGMFPGSDVSDFKSEFSKVGGAAFLQAVETMKGTGALSEAEGNKATQAITSMSLAQSEKAFVKAANEFRDAINKGYMASQQKAGVMPFNPSATPSVGGAQPKLKYNLQTGEWN